MKDWLQEQRHSIVDSFYFWFGTDEYLKVREPYKLFNKWVCVSIEWRLFDTYKEAKEALNNIGKDVV